MCWIKLHRKLLEWEWMDDAEVLRAMLIILMSVNYEDKKWHGTVIHRGEMITSISGLSKILNRSVRQTRTFMSKLQSSEFLTCAATSQWTRITICNYDKYQIVATNERQTSDKRATTTKEYKEYNNNITTDRELENAGKPATKSLEERKQDFYNSLVPYVEKYGKEMIRAFYNYWSEHNANGKKMKWEKVRDQKNGTWNTELRLVTWHERDNPRTQTKPKEVISVNDTYWK